MMEDLINRLDTVDLVSAQHIFKADLSHMYSQTTLTTENWIDVDKVYHATDKCKDDGLEHIEQLDTLVWRNADKTSGHCPCSLFSCNLYENEHPTISPYVPTHIVILVPNVFQSEDDFLIPIIPYPVPPKLPDERYRSSGGRTYIEIVYICNDNIVDLELK
jgi:hypothetical protein